MLRKLLLISAAAVGGIYLTSEEGKVARAALMKKKATFEPVVKDLMQQMNEILEGSKQINSDEVRANVNLLVKEAKQTIVEIDLEKTVETIRDAIRVASKKIREAEFEVDKTKTVKIALNEAPKQKAKEEVKKTVAKETKKAPVKKTKKAVKK